MTNDRPDTAITRYEESRSETGDLDAVSGTVRAEGGEAREFAFGATAEDGRLVLDKFGPHTGRNLGRSALWAFAACVRDLRARGHEVDTGPLNVPSASGGQPVGETDGGPRARYSCAPPTDEQDGVGDLDADVTREGDPFHGDGTRTVIEESDTSEAFPETAADGAAPPADPPLDRTERANLAWAYEHEPTISDAVEWFAAEYDAVYQALIQHGIHVPGNSKGKSEDAVLDVLSDHDGELPQPELIDELGWSRAKVRQVLDRLEGNGDVERVRRGRKNVIRVPDAVPGSDADGEGDERDGGDQQAVDPPEDDVEENPDRHDVDGAEDGGDEPGGARAWLDQLDLADDEVATAFAGATSLTGVMRSLNLTDRGTAATLADQLGLLEDLRSTGTLARRDVEDALAEVDDAGD